jgi:hypothetical protein
MDMKRILQAMDGVATKPVVGANSMTKFLSIIDKNDVEILNEAANPHKVSLPVQMVMQHYQKEETEHKPVGRESVIRKYFKEVEEELTAEKTEKRQLINQYASIIAERVLMKEAANPAQQAAIAIAKKKKKVKENNLSSLSVHNGPGMEITPDTGGNLSLETHNQEHGSPYDLGSADAYYGRSANHNHHHLNDHDDIRAYYHGYRAGEDLHDPSNYDESVSENLRTENPCWKGYHPVGTKKKGGRTVPNCVPKD